ncbi:hypothetical protein GCM10027586_07370 [Kineococcus gypseus]|uniref:hypothetical protein n=1 Tax=Kineococcus gypseus TaxID=1637102 RepID=UPI003D7DD3C3
MWRYEHTSWRVQVRAHLSTPGPPVPPAGPAAAPPSPLPLLQVQDITGAWVTAEPGAQPLEVPLLPDGVALLAVELLRPPKTRPHTGTSAGNRSASAHQATMQDAKEDAGTGTGTGVAHPFVLRPVPQRIQAGQLIAYAHDASGRVATRIREADVVHFDPMGGSLPPPRPFEGWRLSLLRPDTASFSLSAPVWWRTPGSTLPASGSGSAPQSRADGAPDGQLSIDVHVLPRHS